MFFRKLLENQRKAMEEYKWFKGEKLGYDPGEAACREWVEKYAANYREEYNELFNEMVDKVVKYTYNKIQNILSNSKTQLSQEDIHMIAKVLIEEFTNQWITEKVNHPDNKHIDEI